MSYSIMINKQIIIIYMYIKLIIWWDKGQGNISNRENVMKLYYDL